MWTYLPRVFLLDSSLISPLEMGEQSDSERVLTRGANDSIACLFSFIRWHACERCWAWCMQEEGHTSQFSRTKQRLPATDLSGPKASAESLTPRRSNLVVAYAVDFQFDLILSVAALGSTLSRGIASGL